MTNKHAFVEKLKSQLDEWDEELARWEADAHEVREELRIAFDERRASLKQQLKEAGERFERIQDETDEAWDDVKGGAEAAWNSLREAFAKARSEFTGK